MTGSVATEISCFSVFWLDVVWPRRITWFAGGQHNYCSDFSSRVFGTFQSWAANGWRL